MSATNIVLNLSALVLVCTCWLQGAAEAGTGTGTGTGILSKNSKICQDFNIQIVTNKLPLKSNARSWEESRQSEQQKNSQKLYYEQKGQLHSQVVGTNSEFAVVMYGPEPIQWMYDGPGQPFIHSETREQSKSGCYMIKLVRPPNMELQASGTGRYTVRSEANPLRKESLYFYVPNKYPPFLLNTERLQSVELEDGKPLVLPCLLNDPSVKVTVSKRVGLNEWQEAHNVGTYNPQVGFTIRKPFNGATTLYGSYKCFTSLHNRNDTVFMYVAPAGSGY